MFSGNRLTSGQKCFLIACVGTVSMAVLGVMTYLVPECVRLIREA